MYCLGSSMLFVNKYEQFLALPLLPLLLFQLAVLPLPTNPKRFSKKHFKGGFVNNRNLNSQRKLALCDLTEMFKSPETLKRKPISTRPDHRLQPGRCTTYAPAGYPNRCTIFSPPLHLARISRSCILSCVLW